VPSFAHPIVLRLPTPKLVAVGPGGESVAAPRIERVFAERLEAGIVASPHEGITG
jgi:hypothetical protein